MTLIWRVVPAVRRHPDRRGPRGDDHEGLISMNYDEFLARVGQHGGPVER